MPWGLIIIGAVFLVLKLLSTINDGQQQPGPPDRPPVRPPGEKPERDRHIHWEASQEQLDRYFDQQHGQTARASAPAPPGRAAPPQLPKRPIAQPQRRPAEQQWPRAPQPEPQSQRGPAPPPVPERPASPVQQILQMPAQIAEAQRQVAEERQQIARERQYIARQIRELKRRQTAVPVPERRQPARPAASRPVTAKGALRGAANLRKAVVLAEVLGPPKSLRHAHRHKGGII